jgi:hypothetical protein
VSGHRCCSEVMALWGEIAIARFLAFTPRYSILDLPCPLSHSPSITYSHGSIGAGKLSQRGGGCGWAGN